MLINKQTLELLGYDDKDAIKCIHKLYQNCPSGTTKQVRRWKQSTWGKPSEQLVSMKHVNLQEALSYLAKYTLTESKNYKANMQVWKELYTKLLQLKG